MEAVITTYFDTDWNLSPRQAYVFWKYNRSKYCQWLHYKNKDRQGIDIWDNHILKSMVPGTTVVYDSQAIFWKRLIDNVRVVENAVPKLVQPYVEILTPEIDKSLIGTVSNLILYRPLSIKLTTSLKDYLTVPMLTRSGMTPNLLTWLKDDAKIYISIGQEFFHFNRFKYTLLDFIELEAEKLYQEFGLVLTMKVLSKNDLANGNLKLIFERQ
jgi:hypothetical protein